MSKIFDFVSESYPAVAREILLREKEERTDTRIMWELASYVVDAFEEGGENDVRPAFDKAESLIAEDWKPSRDLAVIDFLETVQNVASHRACGLSAFEPFLGPSCVKAWAWLKTVWAGKSTLAEVVAAENGHTSFKRKQKLTPREMLEKVENPQLRKEIEQMTREHLH